MIQSLHNLVMLGTKKNHFLHFKHLYLIIYKVEVYEISSRHSHTITMQDPTI